MSTTLTTPHDQIENPSEDDLAHALDTILASSNELDDLWLENAEGWALSVVPSGDVFFEQLDEEGYETLGPLSRDAILRLLQLLAEGQLAELRAEPWEEGA